MRTNQKFRALLAFHKEALDALEGEAREKRIAELRAEWDEEADPPLKSFLDMTDQGLGEIPFEDQAEAEKIILDGLSLADFQDGEEALKGLLQPLQPKQRRRIFQEGLVKRSGEKKRRKKMVSGPEAAAIDSLQAETSQGFSQKETVARRKRLREIADKEGPEEARTAEDKEAKRQANSKEREANYLMNSPWVGGRSA